MIKAIIFDLSFTLLFPKDVSYSSELNKLYKEKQNIPGFNFSDYFYLDEKTLSYIDLLKNKYKLYVFTSGVIQDAQEISENLKTIFKEIYSAEKLKLRKSEPEAYKVLAQKINMNPDEILFIDDQEKNVSAAAEAGLETELYLKDVGMEKIISKYL